VKGNVAGSEEEVGGGKDAEDTSAVGKEKSEKGNRHKTPWDNIGGEKVGSWGGGFELEGDDVMSECLG